MADKPQDDSGGAEQRRAYYRLKYPESARPTVVADDMSLPVVELSEGGLRLVLLSATALDAGRPFQGQILFHDGGRLTIAGKVARMEGREAIIQLDRGISFKRMFAEQVWLHQHYRSAFDGEQSNPEA